MHADLTEAERPAGGEEEPVDPRLLVVPEVAVEHAAAVQHASAVQEQRLVTVDRVREDENAEAAVVAPAAQPRRR